MTNAEELKSSGLKATLPRIKILDLFQRAQQRHMTAEDVFKILLSEGSDIGLATEELERPALPAPEQPQDLQPTAEQLRLEDARRLARENPVAVASIIKTWVNGE